MHILTLANSTESQLQSELTNLETTLAASPEQKHAVYLTMKDCADCSANETRLSNAFSSISENNI